jgi:hypothetical protein
MPGPFGLAAPWAGGYERRSVGQDGFLFYAAARNLRTGDRRHCFVNGGNHPYAPPAQLLINQGGDMAWAAVAPGAGGMVEVGVCDGLGRRVVAEGTGIDTDSTTLRGSTLSWTDSGARQSVVLAP